MGSPNYAPALNASIGVVVAGGATLVTVPRGEHTLSSKITREVPAGASLVIQGEPGATIRCEGGMLDLRAPVVAELSPAVGGTRGDSTLVVEDTSGIRPGDIIRVDVPLVLETGWHRDLTETHVVEAVESGTVLRLGDPLSFTWALGAAVEYVADGSTTRFWYPSYYVNASDVEVLADGVPQAVTLAPKDGTIARGFHAEFPAPPAAGTRLVFRNRAPFTFKVRRGGDLTIRGITFTSAHGGEYVHIDGLKNPLVEGCTGTHGHYLTEPRTGVGDYFTAFSCYRPRFRNITTRGGRYGVHIKGGRHAHVDDVFGELGWHPVSVSCFAVDTVMENVTGYGNEATVDAHPALDVHMRHIRGLSDQRGVNNRAHGGSLHDVHSTAVLNDPYTDVRHGIAWITDGVGNPHSYMAKTGRFTITDSTLTAPGGFHAHCHSVGEYTVTRSTIDGEAGNSGSLTTIGLTTMRVTDSTITRVRPRAVDTCTVAGSTVGELSPYNGWAQALGDLTVTASTIGNGRPGALGHVTTGRRVFLGCTFTHSDLFTGGDPSTHEFIGCTGA